jgi:hypothetical protein
VRGPLRDLEPFPDLRPRDIRRSSGGDSEREQLVGAPRCLVGVTDELGRQADPSASGV